ncbi:MAG: response regulator transcription factor [Ferruginibacter sp.]|nr:response regulator transcription factor [Chitinophagaceae bacterium]
MVSYVILRKLYFKPFVSNHPITILLVDDHRLIRESWSEVLKNESQFQVIGSAGSAEEGIEIATNQRPRIVLMDINMLPVNGFEATKAIRKFSPGSKIIAVSMHAIPAYAKKMFQIGAVGYVTKNSSKEELVKAILEVNEGRKYICDEVKAILSNQELEQTIKEPDINVLSKREIEVAQAIKEAMSSKEIALKLGISLKTVEVHRYNMLKKLHLKNTAALVNFLNENGL